MEPKVSNEEILNAFIEKDKERNENLKFESLEMKSQVILLKHKIGEISKIVDLLYNNQNIDKKEK